MQSTEMRGKERESDAGKWKKKKQTRETTWRILSLLVRYPFVLLAASSFHFSRFTPAFVTPSVEWRRRSNRLHRVLFWIFFVFLSGNWVVGVDQAWPKDSIRIERALIIRAKLLDYPGNLAPEPISEFLRLHASLSPITRKTMKKKMIFKKKKNSFLRVSHAESRVHHVRVFLVPQINRTERAPFEINKHEKSKAYGDFHVPLGASPAAHVRLAESFEPFNYTPRFLFCVFRLGEEKHKTNKTNEKKVTLKSLDSLRK